MIPIYRPFRAGRDTPRGTSIGSRLGTGRQVGQDHHQPNRGEGLGPGQVDDQGNRGGRHGADSGRDHDETGRTRPLQALPGGVFLRVPLHLTPRLTPPSVDRPSSHDRDASGRTGVPALEPLISLGGQLQTSHARARRSRGRPPGSWRSLGPHSRKVSGESSDRPRLSRASGGRGPRRALKVTGMRWR